MAAPLTVLQDRTPLLGPQIDTGARIGWMLRTARLISGQHRFDRLEDMAAAVDSNVTALHRIEPGRARRGVVGDADGVVVVAAELLGEVIEAAEQRAATEQRLFAALRAGNTTVDLLQLDASLVTRLD